MHIRLHETETNKTITINSKYFVFARRYSTDTKVHMTACETFVNESIETMDELLSKDPDTRFIRLHDEHNKPVLINTEFIITAVANSYGYGYRNVVILDRGDNIQTQETPDKIHLMLTTPKRKVDDTSGGAGSPSKEH